MNKRTLNKIKNTEIQYNRKSQGIEGKDYTKRYDNDQINLKYINQNMLISCNNQFQFFMKLNFYNIKIYNMLSNI